MHMGIKPAIQQLLAAQERGSVFFPANSRTGCRDFYELSTGVRSVLQDNSTKAVAVGPS